MVELLNYGGHECMAEFGVGDSHQPGEWMNFDEWKRILGRLGVDQPSMRVNYFNGFMQQAQFEELIVKAVPCPFNCGDAVKMGDAEWLAGKMRIVHLLIGQCPACRRVIWMQVLRRDERPVPDTYHVVVSAGTHIINGPPRRWA